MSKREWTVARSEFWWRVVFGLFAFALLAYAVALIGVAQA